jgi:tRNA-dihydrouridine synthase A
MIRRFLGQSRFTENYFEGPTVLQLGGSDPSMLKEASNIVMELTSRKYCDYTALNLNCGCPSPKVAGKGCFGAALMEDPELGKYIKYDQLKYYTYY